MHSAIHILSLISIISLTLGSLTGCGEKRVHVATVSGEAGQEMALVPDENLQAQTSGLGNESVDESALLSQIPDDETVSPEQFGSDITNEPVNMAHESTGDDNSFAPLDEGQDFLAQSSSTPGDHSNQLSNIEDFREPTRGQDFSASLKDSLNGEGIEPVPNAFQIAKADPADSLQDQMNRIKEESAAKAAHLEDVFFQFDSWTLTPEGKQSLERTRGWFDQNSSSNLIIEGHADQRGTQAYNMVLAKRRAVAVQDYLSQLGVAPTRLAVISYGKDKPFCLDVTDTCHQLNRRGHLLVQNP